MALNYSWLNQWYAVKECDATLPARVQMQGSCVKIVSSLQIFQVNPAINQ